MHGPEHVIALDQENRGLVAVIDGAIPVPFDPHSSLGALPVGGGYVVADQNAWAVRNPRSQSQYCWDTQADLDQFLDELAVRGYRAMAVANKTANNLYVRARLEQADAVIALADHVHRKIGSPAAGPGNIAWCGCIAHRTFDGGSRVLPGKVATIDRSFGQRTLVVDDFLVLQNRPGGYTSAFMDAALAIAWGALDREGRDLLGMLKTRCEAKSLNRVAAIAVCTHSPWTGGLRTHGGAPWGVGFICDRVIGLNGAMQGTGAGAAGNPMRAVLRSLGKGKSPEKLGPTDRAVRTVIRALQAHPALPHV